MCHRNTQNFTETFRVFLPRRSRGVQRDVIQWQIRRSCRLHDSMWCYHNLRGTRKGRTWSTGMRVVARRRNRSNRRAYIVEKV